jgi:hypothetical protein
MKKWLVGFVALFVAVGAYAQDLNSYMPADAMVVGSVDGSAILDSTFIRRVIFISTQKTVDDILKEKGLTMEQAKKQCGTALFFLKIAAGNPMPQFEGGAIIRSTAKDSFKDINTITQQSLDAELKKNAELLALMQQSGMKIELTKVVNKNSVLISMQNPVVQIILTGINDRMFQVRFATEKPVDKTLLKPLKQYSALTKKIDSKALFSIAADVQSIAKLAPQQQQDPVAASIKTFSASVSEANNNLILQADIEAVSPDAANMLHAQINAVIAMLKNDPANKALADMMKLNLKGNNVEFKGVFPVDFVINMLTNAAVKNSQKPAATGAAPAPAAK